ncbi:PAQR family membrane homeostasis protein TrhA [Eudoraea chungangensis]|uniref:PAQR family membrane homeostasis protein TrhA n=1 Tax=Eudoraea chungangensis TaxID=1481905 RepID=UPI0023ECF46A|nr:hemolysin III family protein [Eudoraea chungangensis]
MEWDYHKEERLNALSHAIGIVLGILGFFLLLKTNSVNTQYATLSLVIYSVSIILLFSASTFYHYVSSQKLKEKLRIVDHISIFCLIAGTYTPVALISLSQGNGWLIFYSVWTIAFIGAVLKVFFTGKFEVLSLLLYLFMGWLIVFDLKNLILNTTFKGQIFLALGGAFYTLGIFFYAFKRIPYNHLIWHFFVLGGAICHWLFIYLDVIQ